MAINAKNILFLSSWYPNAHQPFVGNFIRRQAELLATQHVVTVVHTVASDEEAKMRLETTSEGNLTEHIVYHPRGKNGFRKLRLQKKALLKALKEIRNIDIIYTSILLPKALQFIAAKKRFNCPWIHLEQGSYFRPQVWKEWPKSQKLMARKAGKHIDELFVGSAFLKKDMEEIFPSHSIGIVPNHVDTDVFICANQKNKSTTTFLHISTLDPNTKDPKGMIDACAILKKKIGSSFSFQIISDGESEMWKEYVQSLGLTDTVLFDGHKEWKDLPKFYQSADAFVLNSVYETFSIVLAESWATGTPTITTPVGIGYDIPPHLGMQTKIGNPQQLAETMEEFIQQKENYDSLEIRKRALQYSAKNVLQRFNEIISDHVK
ncbi:MAG: glycosyltransferase [Crocinitomicaceae bacterium]|nr:glycosyltransferase [Crocinitomicaceae bacterium]